MAHVALKFGEFVSCSPCEPVSSENTLTVGI